MAYVKFQRGTVAAYNALGTKDPNTLYFLYPENGSPVGSLYIGDRVISKGDTVVQNANLGDLANVMIESAGTGDFLVLNADGKWIPKTATSLAEDILAGVPETKVYNVLPQEGETDAAAITRVVGEDTLISAGDMAIVKRTIAADKQSYTAYVRDNLGNWSAMDGNYSAENVYFADDFVYTASIGVKTVPSSGSGTIAATGKNVKEVLASIFAQEKNPTKTNPSCSVTLTGGNKDLEVGSKVTPAYTTGFNKGSYQYGPDTGITATSYSVVFNGETLTTATGTFSEYTVAAGQKKISATINYSEGSVPKTNLGNPYEAGKIAAGSCSATSTNYINGYRNMFYGPMGSADAELNSANIRALANKRKEATGNLPTFGAGAGAAKVVVAVPAGRRISKVIMPSALNADVTSLFVKQSDAVAVEGANGYTAANYDVYVYQPAAIDAGETYTITIA